MDNTGTTKSISRTRREKAEAQEKYEAANREEKQKIRQDKRDITMP